ncbi:RNA polymerase sigma factor [Spirosoma aerolatum]|uniref:RNA polymerase sigma factor n=1 Tax=Spirosoma aerolatum TaxID=1211326 RepID=UPI0009AC26D3|nr:sigma-70 family RNA polymerase sigma factor [Spirosoma aerolatum]
MSLFSRHLADAEIIEGLLAGGVTRLTAENRLYGKYLFLIRDGVRKHQLSDDDCATIYADTILAAIEQISSGRFEGRSELRTYLYQIFTNKCVDFIRKKTTNRQSVHQAISLDDSLMQLPDSARSVVQKLIDQSDWERLLQQLRSLGEKCYQMLLAWGEGYSDEEIAQQMSYHTASVAKTSRLRCLERLRDAYNQIKK